MDIPATISAARRAVGSLALDERLDAGVQRLSALADQAADRVGLRVVRTLEGEQLGHPLHPALTDLPIGFWTSAFVLDLAGRRAARASTSMVAAGLACALPTAAAGLADWRRRETAGEQRVGVAHAAANGAATVLYLLSLAHRLRGNHVRGVALGMLGATAATAGGFLGGHLAFGELPDGTSAAEVAGVVDPQGAALAATAN